MESITKKVLRISVVAAIYVALTLVLHPISYGSIQLRISEILVLLCFFRKDYVISLTIGCLISNAFSQLGVIDIVLGTFATFISCIFIAFSKKLLISTIYPVLFNSVIIGIELAYVYDLPYVLQILYVLVGEVLVMVIGYILFKALRKNEAFLKLIKATKK